MNNKTIQLNEDGICIDGEYKILICASLFYFRIPSELWHDRIKKIKKLGYNCVEIYFPWNYHEVSPGKWDFSREKNIENFLDLLLREQMYVIARPGPYICSEWDGGGIPAWILTGKFPIREANEEFLKNVNEWFSRILPRIAPYQHTKGGNIILLQLENELDFFDCQDPKLYMNELRNIAKKYGIEVPMFGCAGQGSVERATGCAKGVEKTFNFYPNPTSKEFDYCCYLTYEKMKYIGKPLLITETNRDYFTLRRELACGAKLISPYNQVAGTNFGFTNGINNWGTDDFPLSFITSDYNFLSDISSAGEYSENALEGRLFTSLIKSLGSSLALSCCVMEHDFTINTNFTEPKYGFTALKLSGGGWLICIPNISNESGTAHITGNDIDFSVDIGPFQAPFLPVNIPLNKWGIDGMIKWSSAEIGPIYENEDEIKFIIYSEKGGKACFIIPDARYIDGRKIKDDELLLSEKGDYCIFKQRNKIVHILLVDKEQAARLEPDFSKWTQEIPSKREKVLVKNRISICKSKYMNKIDRRYIPIVNVEQYGLWRGYAFYEVETKKAGTILLKGVADIISAYKDNQYVDTRISGGQWQIYDDCNTGKWNFRVEIWGHSNFDDSRLQSTRLKSGKGIDAAFEIIREEDISDCWAFDYFNDDLTEKLKISLGGLEPLLSPNSWNSTRIPVNALYRRKILLDKDCDSAILYINNNRALSYIYVNGEKVGIVNPIDPFVDISPYISPGEKVEIAIAAVKKTWNEPIGDLKLLHCNRIQNCYISFISDDDVTVLLKNADKYKFTELPIKLKSGGIEVLKINLDNFKKDCAYMHFKGKNIKLTILFNDRIVGRILLKDDKLCNMVGGYTDRCYIPGPWFKEKNNYLSILVEAIGEQPSIDKLTMEYV